MVQRGRRSSSDLSTLRVDGRPSRIDPPESLTEPERILFCELVSNCEPEHLRPADQPLLLAYIQAILVSQDAVKRVVDDPAALVIWEKSTRLLSSLAARLRLCPQSRIDGRVAGKQPQQFPPPWLIPSEINKRGV